jgi:hypothetical protein
MPTDTIDVTDTERTAARLLRAVWKQIDFDQVDTGRDMTSEFTSRAQAAANEPNLKRFLQTLARKMGVRGLTQDPDLLEALQTGNEAEVLDKTRNETMFLVLLMQEGGVDQEVLY